MKRCYYLKNKIIFKLLTIYVILYVAMLLAIKIVEVNYNQHLLIQHLSLLSPILMQRRQPNLPIFNGGFRGYNSIIKVLPQCIV